ncbi:hypothetical protein [Kangiella shandongensis]|uniref:hypothetical protein n=1 Tax=Kangiella shandongensis TaxID=2763258 RepID=UPI001CBE9305|nr:hypothetical protein [Kangiella shandongensis]
MTHLELSNLTEEQCTKITQGIVNDLIRALNLGNYSLIWRYFTDGCAEEISAERFLTLRRKITEEYQELQSAKLETTQSANNQIEQKWVIQTNHSKELVLKITLVPVKEFLAIDSFHIK